MENAKDFSVVKYKYFKVEHCYECLVPGYLIVSPVMSISSLAALPRIGQEELGPVLAAATEAIQNIIAPIKIYCAQFGEEEQQLHFHVFPRTFELTTEFLRAFPAQQDLIYGPILFDWARSHYRASKFDVWRLVSPVISALREEFNRITSRSP